MVNSAPMGNLEIVARDICRIQLSQYPIREDKRQSDIDRFWHVVAASLEAGLIDDTGEPTGEYSFEEGLEAYRDWRDRNPSYAVPDRT